MPFGANAGVRNWDLIPVKKEESLSTNIGVNAKSSTTASRPGLSSTTIGRTVKTSTTSTGRKIRQVLPDVQGIISSWLKQSKQRA